MNPFVGIKILCGNATSELAAEIARHLGLKLAECRVGRFSDGEIQLEIGETVRGCDVYVVQSLCAPVNDNLMELLVILDALRRASAARITAVIPYFGYARQDRKSKAREPITAKLVANLITVAGADRVLTMDLHAPQLQGFFDIPVDHLLSNPIFVSYYQPILDKQKEDVVVVCPDIGSVARSRVIAERMDVPLVIVDKRRPRANVSEVMNLIGDVRGRYCILIDDLIDTAGTICQAAQALRDHGAKAVVAGVTHPVLSGPAVDRLKTAPIDELLFLNTIPLPENKRLPQMRVLSVSMLFADAIERIYRQRPVSPLFTEAPKEVAPLAVQERMTQVDQVP